MEASGKQEEQQLRNAGFSDDEVTSWKSEQNDTLYKGGFSDKEVNDYWGVPKEDLSGMRTHVDTNIKIRADAEAEKAKNSTGTSIAAPAAPPKPAQGLIDALEAGWDTSVSGLLMGRPDTVLPENAGRAMQIVSQIGTLAGDLPAMAAGMVSGAAAGTAMGTATVPGIGTISGAVVGAGAGGFAVPSAMRKILMDHYEKGDILSAQDFADRVVSTAWEATKGGVTGGVTSLVGGAIGANLLKAGAGAALAQGGTLAAEIATMTSVSTALEGHLPNSDDFINAGILVGGLHGIATVTPKLRGVYKNTGERPEALLEIAGQNDVIKQDLVVRKSVGPLLEPEFKRVDLPENSLTKSFGELGPVEKPVGIVENVKAKGKETLQNLYENVVDDLIGVKRLVESTSKGELPTANDPYALMRTYKDYHGKVQNFYENQTLDFKTLEPNGPGLKSILEKAPEKAELSDAQNKVLSRISESGERDTKWGGLTSYLVSKRAIELDGRGIKTGIDLESAKTVVTEGRAEYEAISKELQTFKKKRNDYAVDSGLVSRKEMDRIDLKNEDHVSFFREKEDGGVFSGDGKVFQEIKGSESKILDPILSEFKTTERVIKMAEKNRAMQELVKLPDHPFKKVESRGPLKENEFAVYKKGERQVYEAPEDFVPALKSLGGDPGVTGLFMTMARGFAKGLRMGTTMTPEFIARNAFRDQLTAGVQSQYKQIPFVDAYQAVGHIFKKDAVWYDFLASGGAMGSFGEVARSIDSNVWGLNKEVGMLKQTWNVIKTPIEAVGALSEMIENVPRVAEFKRAGGVGGDLSQKVSAGLAARDVTADFARKGARMSAMRSIVPFLGAHIQGTDRFIQTIKDRPGQALASSIASVTLPSALLWWANKDDSRIKDAPNWQKDLFWLIPGPDAWTKSTYQAASALPNDLKRQMPDGSWEVNDGVVWRLPKPPVIGQLMGSAIERTLDAFYSKDPGAFKDFGETIVQSLTPNVLPTMAVPVMEQVANRSFFTGSPIVTSTMQKYTPEYRYNDYTSETAKQLGKIIRAVPYLGNLGPEQAELGSPPVIDNYIRAWTGEMGNWAVRIIDQALTSSGVANEGAPKPTKTLADYPIVKAFVFRNPSMGMQPITDFQDNYKETSKVMDTYMMLAKSGNFDAANKLMEVDQGSFVKLDGFDKAIQKQNQFIHSVMRDTTMSPDDKRQLIDSTYYQMSMTARMGNETLRTFRESAKVAK